jgi:hypothetical protein
MENALSNLMLMYSNLSSKNIHCSLSQSAIATLVKIFAVTQTNAFIAVLLKILNLAFRADTQNEQMIIKTVRVLHEGVYIHCYVVCSRSGRTLHIEMIIHEPRNR